MKNGKYEDQDSIRWYKDGVFHREDGPAIVYANGDKWWYHHGVVHRVDGPAIEGADGHKAWYFNGKLHRLDGPAIERADGYKEWWVDGQSVDVLTVFGYEPSVPLSDEEQLLLRMSI